MTDHFKRTENDEAEMANDKRQSGFHSCFGHSFVIRHSTFVI